jgi:hypothetical protein
MNRVWLLSIGLAPLTAIAQVELVPEATPQTVFAAGPQEVRVTLHNPGSQTAEADIQTRLFQLTQASAVPIGDVRPWKKMQVLPRQTVLETVTIPFPEVRAATRFRLELVGIGRTEVLAYPPDLLKRLQTLAGDPPLGVFDPDRQLKPLLKRAGVNVADFEIEPTNCRLALVWSSAENLPDSVVSRVKTGMAAVWIRPSRVPTTYAARLGAGVVVVVPAATLGGLADAPQPQLNLIRDAELALEPDALRLPSHNRTE